MTETNFNGHKAILYVVVKKIGYDEIGLDLIERGRSQARQANVNVGIEDLALSIRVQGLMEPIHLVKIENTGKYELIDGQRRFQVYGLLRDRHPGEFSKIPSFCYEGTMEDWEKKSFSLNANLTQAPMSDVDKVNAVTAVYNHFGTIKSTKEVTGLSEPTIRKYVKVSRLPPSLKDAVNAGEVKITSALDASDMYGYDANDQDSADVSKIMELAKIMQTTKGKEKKRIKERVKEHPEIPPTEIAKEGKGVPLVEHEIVIKVETDTYERISVYKDKKDDINTIQSAAAELVEEGLTANDL